MGATLLFLGLALLLLSLAFLVYQGIGFFSSLTTRVGECIERQYVKTLRSSVRTMNPIFYRISQTKRESCHSLRMISS